MRTPQAFIRDRYALYEPLGKGAMSTVYDAMDRANDAPRAIKLLDRVTDRDDDARERFTTVVLAVARLGHPGMLAVHDIGTERDRPYIVTERAEGPVTGKLTLEQAITAIQQVLAALGAAHQVGLVHRDVKPANILRTADGRVVLGDFGIATLGRSVEPVTADGRIVARPAFAPPELVLDSSRVDSRADVYGAGATLFAWLTGDAPGPIWAEDDAQRKWQAVPESVRGVLQRALARRPADRHEDAAELAVALAHATGIAQASSPAVAEAAFSIRGDAPPPTGTHAGVLSGRRPADAELELHLALRDLDAVAAVAPPSRAGELERLLDIAEQLGAGHVVSVG